jgi:two-component system, OmpR family, sensor kinase
VKHDYRGFPSGNPVTRYVRARLHRRIFFLLGGSIFLTALIFGVAQWSIGGAEWKRELYAAQSFASHRFEKVWERAEARDELARSMADDLRLDVKLSDAGRIPIRSFGESCTHPALTVPINRAGETLGYVEICVDRVHPRPRGGVLFSVLVAVCVLWAASGRIARRLTRPYGELARVAHDIGMGKLSSRFQLSPWTAHGEARMLADAINDMAERIERQMKDQRELLAGVSHEIRTPLARVRLLVELCRSHPAPDGTLEVKPKTLDEIDSEVVEVDALVSELLASARLDFAALSLHELDARDLARRALERLGVNPSKLRIETESTRLTADPTLVARALANLIENAMTHGGGLDALVLRSANGAMVFEALDRGPGFLPGEETRVFQSFYQRPGAAPREKGALGLGLTLVKRIAQAHGGNALAKNRVGGGASVRVEVPVKGG